MQKHQKHSKQSQAVERAKQLLMKRRGMTEPEAHRYLQQQAMDRRMPKAEFALSILRDYRS